MCNTLLILLFSEKFSRACLYNRGVGYPRAQGHMPKEEEKPLDKHSEFSEAPMLFKIYIWGIMFTMFSKV